MYSNRTGNKKVAVKLERELRIDRGVDKKQDKPGQKIFPCHLVLFEKKGVNLLRSAKLVNALIFSDACKTHPD